jgi:pentatricopeptide repeat protein
MLLMHCQQQLQAALNALRDCGMGVEAVALLKEMKTLKLAPNEHSYTAAVEACSAGGHVRYIHFMYYISY